MDLYGGNGKTAKAEPESINDRPKRSMIGRRVKTMEDLARQLQKCTGYMLPSFVYPAINCTKLAAFVSRYRTGRKRAGYMINDLTCVHAFLSIIRANTQLFRARWLAAHLVQCSDGMFSQIRDFTNRKKYRKNPKPREPG